MADSRELKLSHLDDHGRAKMVDVGGKSATLRTAIAEGEISFSAEAMQLLVNQQFPKGDVFGVAKIAGIQAAKRTADLIPLCHPLPISYVDLQFDARSTENKVIARSEVRTTGQTGVEMEALTALSVALLTIYDMVKGVDKSMQIGPIRLVYKEGGKSGVYKAD